MASIAIFNWASAKSEPEPEPEPEPIIFESESVGNGWILVKVDPLNLIG